MPDVTRRPRQSGEERREAILNAALELFGRRNFDAVGMRDVAEACDLSATGIYRHFPNKEAVLIGLFDRLSDQLSAGMRAASRADRPEEILAELIRFHASQAIAEPVLIPVYQREEASLPEQERTRFREVLRVYLSLWTDNLLSVRPDLSREEARTTAVAAFGAINSVAYHRSRLTPRALERVLVQIAARTLGLAVDEN